MKVTNLIFFTLIASLFLSCMGPAQQKVEQGNSYYYKNQWDDAIASYQQALSYDPRITIDHMADAYAKRADAYIKKGELDKAIADTDKYLALSPDANKKSEYALAYRDLGDKLAGERKYDLSMKAYSIALQYGEKDAGLHYYIGEILSAKGEYHAAISEYNQAIQINPTFNAALISRGYAYFKDGEYRKALIDINTAVNNGAVNKEAYLIHGLIFQALGSFDIAVQDYTNAIAMDPQFTDAYWWRGRSYYRLQNYENALSDFNRVIELKPYIMWAALNDRAVVQGIAGDLSAAKVDLDRALQLEPRYLICNFNRGVVYSKMNKPVAGLNDINRYLALDVTDKFRCSALAESWRGFNNAVILVNPHIDTGKLEGSVVSYSTEAEYNFINDIDSNFLYFDETQSLRSAWGR